MGIQVNNHSWLTHEHGDRAIASKNDGRLRQLATQADLVGAHGLADHWRAMADIIALDRYERGMQHYS